MTSFRVYILLLTFFFWSVGAQEIWDIWQTTWSRSKLFTYQKVSPPLEFGTPGSTQDANIAVNEGTTYQTMSGFGGSLTDSAAKILNNLKSTDSDSYWDLMYYLFDPVDGRNAAGLNYIRVNLGASDFADTRYTYVGADVDTSLSTFNINKAPSYLFSTLTDIKSINSLIKIHLIPWSPPGWMKSSGSMNGGSFLSTYSSTYANYLLKSVQGFSGKGLTPYAISIQNEPENSNPTYPTCTMTYSQEGEIGKTLRGLLNNNGFSAVKLIGYDHNWNDAGGYPSNLMRDYGSYFAGVAFHCYSGSVSDQATFHNSYPDKEIYFTECTGTIGSDWWSDIKWQTANLYIGAVNQNARSVLMWNIALDGNGEPRLPGTESCGSGCRPIVNVNSDGSWSVNQEYYGLAEASKAVVPRDTGGPWGQRIQTTVSGTYTWALKVSGFVTKRASSSDWPRYSLVVLNWRDSEGGWNPQPVATTITFRGAQASYTFPVGVTTLWWYAAASFAVNGTSTDECTSHIVYAEHEGKQTTFEMFRVQKDDF
ncbi:glycoside hydrolase [Flagelloscypha sp. PMI_526]|nr:glycoside hydrolase [Flagelloscypha sp. PMI_526]